MNQQTSTEQQTRSRLIDRDLARAGWSASRRTLIEEFVLIAQSGDARNNPEFADYALLGADGKPIAIVEAKRGSRDELAGKRQASDYADRIKARFGEDPFVFLSNGKEIQFWDRDRYPPRKIAGFYTRDDLERLRHQRRYAEPLDAIAINADIAGRDYQMEAIRRVTEGIAAAKRRFLLVMATGTGKTRTTIALVDTLLRAKRLPDFAVTCAAMSPVDAARVRNLDALLNLSRRWTRELKAEYVNQQGKLKRYEAQRLSRGQARHTQAEVAAFAASFRDGLLESEPNHEVHRLLGDVLLEQARLAAWQTELGLVT